MIVGMAGHIDHGKSALVEALTGKGMDPHAEERRRGITLDLHFAPLRLDHGRVAGIVDVPGHEDLIRTMAAGASGIDLLLLVVAADDGPMPQTREHLLVAESLGVRRGVAVLTKADLVGEGDRAARLRSLAEWLRGSALAFGPPLAVSARTGEGIAELRRKIAEGAERIPPRKAFRLPVDRAFSVAGAGTVVTGTAWSGVVAAGDRVTLLPAGIEGRVRSVESFGSGVAAGTAGERVAVALAGIDREAVARGDTLAGDAADWAVTSVFDAEVTIAGDAAGPLKPRQRVRLLVGTAEVMARVGAAAAIAPGGRGVMRFRSEAPLVLGGGDRFVLRTFSPVVTIGGGAVLDPSPPPRSKVADLRRGPALVASLVERRRDGVSIGALAVLAGRDAAEVEREVAERAGLARVGAVVVARSRIESLGRRARELADAEHRRDPEAPGLSLESLRRALNASPTLIGRALDEAGLVADGTHVRRADFTPRARGADPAEERIVARVVAAGLTAPTVAELGTGVDAAGALRRAADAGAVVAVSREWYVSAAALAGLAETLRELGERGPISVAMVRERLGLSRKYLIPLLEWADRSGVTLRQGDVRLLPRRRA